MKADYKSLWIGLVWAFIGLLASPAQAHVRSESHSTWEIHGGAVDLVITIPDLEAKRLTASGERPSDAQLQAYLQSRVYPVSKGKPCALVPPLVVLTAAPGYRKFDLTFSCPSGLDLQLHTAIFFDLVPSHVNFAQIQNVETGEFSEELITTDRQTIDITAGENSALQTAGFLEFVRMGMMHIFTGVDHMSFLIGLVLISRRLKDLVFVVTGFTIGHSLTLLLAVTGILRPEAEYIDALVALTIALIGAENLAVETGNPRPIALALLASLAAMAGLRILGIGGLPVTLLLGSGLFVSCYLMVSGRLADAGRLRMVITLVFGLIHGFGFAANLLTLQLPTHRLAELLLGFNLGVEAGQMTLVLGVAGLAVLLTRFKLALPRPLVVEVASSFLVGLGVFWFISRSFGPLV